MRESRRRHSAGSFPYVHHRYVDRILHTQPNKYPNIYHSKNLFHTFQYLISHLIHYLYRISSSSITSTYPLQYKPHIHARMPKLQYPKAVSGTQALPIVTLRSVLTAGHLQARCKSTPYTTVSPSPSSTYAFATSPPIPFTSPSHSHSPSLSPDHTLPSPHPS
jgi:hypothetical protein